MSNSNTQNIPPLKVYRQQFPFEEIRDDLGDYFMTAQDAMDRTCLSLEHIWSIQEDGDVFIYGPPHHYINVLGFIATDETHNHNTYYEERW